ncbi:protein O-GlcNAcase-like isoform X3 [Athene noctua]|uniref:protein O-GlcNAcase-like isoform X3 n=1 Tax=Athene noctua TaxID=126797 RepID=UPI003EBFB6E7
MAGRPRFLCGVVEGFYGRPWSMEQRKLLFQWLKHRGLNCYMYAPKDELKHRLLWREPYTEHEPACGLSSKLPKSRVWSLFSPFLLARTWCSQVLGIGSCCSKNSGRGASSLCPCLQVAAMGCHSFALLFDDIDPCMCQADRDVFPSLAQAQASVANEVYQELGQPSVFLFCPTEYCSSLCSPSPRQSCYLLTIGQELLPGIGIIWTGPKVVSQELSAALLEEVEGVLRRPPVIWDNLYANDYDCRRVFLGPYTGRAPGLVPRLCGLLLNPNCELQANFIPIHTLGSWFRSELGSGAHPDLTGGRTPGHPSASLKGGTRLQPGTAGGQGVMPDPQPHDSVPGGAEQHGPEPCSMAAGEGRRKATSEPEKGSGSGSPADGQQIPVGDGNQLTPGSRESCEPSSALPGAAGSVQSTGTPGATETLHSPGPTMCCSNGTTSQDLPLPTGGARMGGGSPCQPPSGTQPEASRAEMPQTPPGLGAGASPGPTAPFTDGAGTNPGPTAPLTDGAGASPGPTAPLTDGAGASPGPMAPVILEEAGSSPVALLTLEEAVSGPTVPLTPKEGRTSSTAPLTLEEAGSVPVALLTLEEATSSSTAPVSPEEDTSSPMALLTLAEVQMLVELFYLPYHHGPLAQHLLEHFRWLWANSLSVGVPAPAADACEGTQWRGRAQSFQLLCAQTCRLHSRFVSSAGRALLYDLHPYLWDIRNMLLAASALVLWLDGHLLCDPDPKGTWGSCFGWCQSITAPIPLRGDAEPWARRGGLFGELQALLPVGNSCDLFYHPPPLFPSSQLYVLRPLLPLDKGELYRMCQESLDCDPEVAEILAAHPDLLGDRLLGSFLSLSPEYTFVLEDEEGPCGYAAGALCAEGFLQQRDSSWLPAVRHKYPRDLGAGAPALGQDALEEALLFFHAEPPAVPLPVLRRFPSLVQLGTAPRVLDVGASRSLAICLLSALRANGSRGVFCQVSAADRQQLSFYGKLGFVALPVAWSSSPGAQLLGRLL